MTKKNSSASKVQRAAASGGVGGNTGSGQPYADRNFRLLLATVIISGVFLVGFSWNTRDVAALTPTFGDHWHAAYGIWDCEIDDFRPNLIDPQEITDGIHTHSDGVIHIHPYSSRATGSGATLERFFEGTDTSLEDDSVFEIPGQEPLQEGATCDGETAILQVARFAPGAAEPTDVLTEDLNSLRFNEDLEMIVIALAPEGATIPAPPQANIDAARGSSPDVFRTDGLAGIDNDDAVGFDNDGNLRDADGNFLTDDAGHPININNIAPPSEEG